jgi:hypothetical protein
MDPLSRMRELQKEFKRGPPVRSGLVRLIGLGVAGGIFVISGYKAIFNGRIFLVNVQWMPVTAQ